MSLFSDRLVQARAKANITQRQLAKLLNITPTRLNYWEKGKREPTVELIKEISVALNVSPDFLIGTDLENNFSLSNQEQQLIENFRSLNQEGQTKLLDYSDDLVSSNKYIKNSQPETLADHA